MTNLNQLGMNTSGIQISDELATAVYSAVLDSMGDLDAAIADMRAFEAIVLHLRLLKAHKQNTN